MNLAQFVVAILIFILGGLMGYVTGREHLKSEIRSAVESSFKGTGEGSLAPFAPPKSDTSNPSLLPRVSAGAPLPAKIGPKSITDPSPLTISLITKGFHSSDYRAGDYQDSITFSLKFNNQTGKDIRAFDGVVTFTDLLENQVFSAKLAINEPVSRASSLTWSGQIDYNQFKQEHRKLRNEDDSNLKVQFSPRKILFSDGTVKTYQ